MSTPVETGLGEFLERDHHHLVDPMPLSECLAELHELLTNRETRKD